MNPTTLKEQQTTSITVTIVTMGSGITRYVGEDSLTLGQLLKEIHVAPYTDVRVNGVAAERAYRLMNEDQVLLLPRIRGGAR